MTPWRRPRHPNCGHTTSLLQSSSKKVLRTESKKRCDRSRRANNLGRCRSGRRYLGLAAHEKRAVILTERGKPRPGIVGIENREAFLGGQDVRAHATPAISAR